MAETRDKTWLVISHVNRHAHLSGVSRTRASGRLGGPRDVEESAGRSVGEKQMLTIEPELSPTAGVPLAGSVLALEPGAWESGRADNEMTGNDWDA